MAIDPLCATCIYHFGHGFPLFDNEPLIEAYHNQHMTAYERRALGSSEDCLDNSHPHYIPAPEARHGRR